MVFVFFLSPDLHRDFGSTEYIFSVQLVTVGRTQKTGTIDSSYFSGIFFTYQLAKKTILSLVGGVNNNNKIKIIKSCSLEMLRSVVRDRIKKQSIKKQGEGNGQ